MSFLGALSWSVPQAVLGCAELCWAGSWWPLRWSWRPSACLLQSSSAPLQTGSKPNQHGLTYKYLRKQNWRPPEVVSGDRRPTLYLYHITHYTILHSTHYTILHNTHYTIHHYTTRITPYNTTTLHYAYYIIYDILYMTALHIKNYSTLHNDFISIVFLLCVYIFSPWSKL